MVKHTPDMAGYRGPLSSKVFDAEGSCEIDEVPLLHLKKSDHCFEMEIDVPGLKAKAYNIEIKDGAMVISSEVAPASGADGKLRLVIERKHAATKSEGGRAGDSAKSFTVL